MDKNSSARRDVASTQSAKTDDDPFAPLDAAFAHLPDSAVVVSAEGEIVLWNRGAEKLYGYTFDEARSRDISFLAPPEDSGDTIKLFSRALSGQATEPRRVDRIHKDGSRLRLSLRVSPLENEDGEIFGVLFLGRNLSAEEHREDRINEMRTREREIVTLVPDALYVHRDGKIVWANPAAEEIFAARSLTDLVGRSPWELIEKDDLDEVLRRNAGLGEAKVSRPIYVTRKRLDGTKFSSEGRGAKIFWENEPATLMIVRDLSDQERADTALAESQALQRDFAEISPDAMFVHKHGEIVFANAAALEIYGANTVDELVGHSMREFLHPDDRDVVIRNWSLSRDGVGIDVVRARRLRVDGSEFIGEARFRHISWDGEDAFLVTLRDITEQIEAQAAVEQSEEQHRLIVDASPDGILIHEANKIVFANSAAARIFGAQSQAELIGRSALDLIPEDLHDVARERLALVREDGSTPTTEFRRRRVDGTEFVAEVAGSRYVWQGRPATLSFIRDVSERITAARRRAELEDRWKKILELAPEAIFVHCDGMIRYVNPAALKVFGARVPEDLIGKVATDLIHPDDREEAISNRSRLSDGWQMPLTRFRRLRLDGTEFYSQANGALIDWDDEKGFLVIVRDVSNEIAGQRAVEASERQHRAITQAIPEAVLVTADFEIVFANRAAADMFGVDHPEALYGRRLVDTVHPDEREQVLQSHRDLELGAQLPPFSGRRLRDNGEVFHAETVRAGYTWNGGPATLVVIRDITDRIRAEHDLIIAQQAAETANEMKTRFLASMSHELRTPLNAIIGFSEVIQKQHFGPVSDPRYVEYAGDINRSGQHLLDVINDLLDLSKVEAGEFTIDENRFDLLETVRDAARLLDPLLTAKRLSLEFAAAMGTCEVVAGERQIMQVIVNLLSNAIKFTPEGGKLEVRVRSISGGGIAVDVADNGVGVEPMEIPRLFNEYTQARDLSVRAQEQGTGLGLALCKQLIELHGGVIRMESMPGRGTTVTFVLPDHRVCPNPLEQKSDRSMLSSADA